MIFDKILYFLTSNKKFKFFMVKRYEWVNWLRGWRKFEEEKYHWYNLYTNEAVRVKDNQFWTGIVRDDGRVYSWYRKK